MKKTVSVIVLAAMLICALLSVSVSADGAIVWSDDFSTKDYSNWLWDPPANLFDIENGKVEGWAECVVLQSNYVTDQGGMRRFKECAWKVDACALEDGGNDVERHALGLWFADYLSPYGSEDPEGQIVYELQFDFEKKQIQLYASFDGAASEFEPKSGYTRGEPVAVAAVSDADAPVMDTSGGSVFTLGMRINKGVISGFMNDKKYIDFNAYRGTTTATQLGSPVLLVNGGCHCTFDNVVVATPDYDLFNEGSVISPEPAPAETVKTITTEKVVVGTDADGNEVTEIVTKEVVMPAAQTGTNTNPGTSTATGDMAVIVIAVMVASLAAAVAVGAVATKRRGEE